MSQSSLLHAVRTDENLRNRCDAVATSVVATLQNVEGIDASVWVTTMRVALSPHLGFRYDDMTYAFGTMAAIDPDNPGVSPASYAQAGREEEVCLLAEMDSHETATWAGLLIGIASDYRPKGGGVYDAKYGVIVTTVGLPPLMAILVSRTVRNYYVAKLDEAALRMFKTGDTPGLYGAGDDDAETRLRGFGA